MLRTVVATPGIRKERHVNTIQVVLDHTPSEIADLTEEIATMQDRLREALARKQVLEQLLLVAEKQLHQRPQGMLTLVREPEAIAAGE